MNFIAVGNGSSVMENSLGERVDEFDIVVRFNRGYLDAILDGGYSEQVGLRTDFLVIHDGFCKPDYLNENIFNDVSDVIVGIPAFKVFSELRRIGSYEFAEKITVIPKAVESEINDIVLFENTWPSTGLLGVKYICNLLREGDTLTLFGFDGWNMKYKYYHYFDTAERRLTEYAWKEGKMLHNLNLEVEAMNHLREKYNLRELVND